MAEYYQIPDLSKEVMTDVINFVTSKETVSTAELQIKFKWGYNRAGRTMDRLNQFGIVEEFQGVRSRKVLMTNSDAQKVIAGLS
jgi:S-DNA-T family DNA segregation ATPase FtsK/SpoIIIE